MYRVMVRSDTGHETGTHDGRLATECDRDTTVIPHWASDGSSQSVDRSSRKSVEVVGSSHDDTAAVVVCNEVVP